MAIAVNYIDKNYDFLTTLKLDRYFFIVLSTNMD